MELKPAKKKHFNVPVENYDFPPPRSGNKIACFFQGDHCIVKNGRDAADLYQMGYYGKGSLSRSEPKFNEVGDLPEVILEQQFENRLSYSNQCEETESKVLHDVTYRKKVDLSVQSVSSFFSAVSNSKDNGEIKWNRQVNRDERSQCSVNPVWSSCNSEADRVEPSEELTKLVNTILQEGVPKATNASTESSHSQVVVVEENSGPCLKEAPPRPAEYLQLTLQEAFFLSWALGRVDVLNHSGTVMSHEETWMSFQKVEPKFVVRYVAYHWYRSKGWVVRGALKQGGDFVLYEKGPDFYHSSYVVRVITSEAKLSWNDLFLMYRLVETFKKDILYCTVSSPSSLTSEDLSRPEIINRFRVREDICRRWIPSQQRISS